MRFRELNGGCRIGTAAGCVALGVVCLAATAHARPGDLDPTFSRNGLVRTSFGQKSGASAVAIQPNGRIVAAGSSNRTLALVRYLRGGQLDPTFSGNGKLRSRLAGARTAVDIAFQPDGKIVVLGLSSGQDGILARFNPGGTLDRSFSGDGRLVVADQPIDMALDGDGRIVLAGTRRGTGFSADATLARFLSNGAPDTSFSGDGVAIASFAGYNHAVGTAVAVEPGGKLVLGGVASGEDYVEDHALARFEPDGDLDQSFAGDGTTTLNLGALDRTHEVALRPDGRIVVAGGSCSDPTELYGGCGEAVAQLNPGGSLDGSFGTQGVVLLGSHFQGNHLPSLVSSAAVTPDGGTVLAVDTTTDRQDYGLLDFAVARLDATGSLDASFTRRGFWATDFLSEWDGAHDVALQRNGKIVAVGTSAAVGSSYRDPVVPQIALARYEVESGPRDADADGVRDRLDRCPFRFGRHHGCHRYKRSLTMKLAFSENRFRGVLKSADANCVRGEKVRVLRARRERDKAVETTHTDRLGRWEAVARRHGRFYARALASQSSGEEGTDTAGQKNGRCLKAQSAVLELSR